jgi:hypothetical protein
MFTGSLPKVAPCSNCSASALDVKLMVSIDTGGGGPARCYGDRGSPHVMRGGSCKGEWQ